MLRQLSALSLASVLAGCAANRPEAAAPSGEPLAARVAVTDGGLLMQMNERAHVAVFGVSPAGQAVLLYPAVRGQSRVQSGSSVIIATQGGGSQAQNPTGQLAYVVAIASRERLPIDRYRTNQHALQRVLRTDAELANNPAGIVERIREVFASDQAAGSADVDVAAVPYSTLGVLLSSRVTSRFGERDDALPLGAQRNQVQCRNGQPVAGAISIPNSYCAPAPPPPADPPVPPTTQPATPVTP